MRPKIVLSALVLALAVVAPALYFHFKPASAPPAPIAPAVAADDNAAPAGAVPSILRRVAQPHPQEGLPERQAPPEAMDHDTYVLQRRAELAELGMHNDPESLKIILSELENPDAEIRQAALNATLDFGSKDAIPNLQNELNWASDPQEKVDIQKAIDFLELPQLGTEETSAVQSSDNSAPVTN